MVTFLIIKFGWRESFYALAPLGILCGAWWYWYGRDTPSEHPAITKEEINLINAGRAPADYGLWSPWRVAQGPLAADVLLLTCSYFCSNYVFYMFSNWLFTYLVESRGFSLLESGWLHDACRLQRALTHVRESADSHATPCADVWARAGAVDFPQ